MKWSEFYKFFSQGKLAEAKAKIQEITEEMGRPSFKSIISLLEEIRLAVGHRFGDVEIYTTLGRAYKESGKILPPHHKHCFSWGEKQKW